MAKRKPEEPKGGLPDWLGTYGDLVTLVLCFFVLLYASSSIDAEKFRQIAASFSGKDTLVSGGGGEGLSELMGMGISELPDVDTSINNSRDRTDARTDKEQQAYEEVQKMASEFKTYFADTDFAHSITIEVAEQYISLRLPESILFDTGSAEIKQNALSILGTVGGALNQFSDSDILIEGHTDTSPISTAKYKNNWYLASARANEVAMFFIDTVKLDPSRIQAISCGEYRPIDTNTTAEGRAKNRRVEIKIMSSILTNSNGS